MSNKSDQTYETTPPPDPKKKQNDDPLSDYGKSGGHMGAGKSGNEDMGSEKSSEDPRMGSQKSHADKKSEPSDDK